MFIFMMIYYEVCTISSKLFYETEMKLLFIIFAHNVVYVKIGISIFKEFRYFEAY